MDKNSIEKEILESALTVQKKLGLEQKKDLYLKELSKSLALKGLTCEAMVDIPIAYENIINETPKADLIVNDLIIVGVKVVETLQDNDEEELQIFLKLCKKEHGLLINFQAVPMEKDIRKIFNKTENYY